MFLHICYFINISTSCEVWFCAKEMLFPHTRKSFLSQRLIEGWKGRKLMGGCPTRDSYPWETVALQISHEIMTTRYPSWPSGLFFIFSSFVLVFEVCENNFGQNRTIFSGLNMYMYEWTYFYIGYKIWKIEIWQLLKAFPTKNKHKPDLRSFKFLVHTRLSGIRYFFKMLTENRCPFGADSPCTGLAYL